MKHICFITFHTDRAPVSIACHSGTYELAPSIQRRAIIRWARDQGHLSFELAHRWLCHTIARAVNQP